MPPPPFFLQATELTKQAATAAGGVTEQMNQQGPLYLLLWLLVLAASGIAVWMYLKADKVIATAQVERDKAVATAREEWARQQAIDNGHAAEMLSHARSQEKDALNRLDTINRELRQQEVKSVEVLSGLRTALNQVYSILYAVQHQLQGIETALNPSRPPTLPPPTQPPTL